MGLLSNSVRAFIGHYVKLPLPDMVTVHTPCTLNPTAASPRHRELTDHIGPDVCIDAVGSHYATGIVHKLEYNLQLEMDTPEIVNECIETVRKGGRVSVIAAYVGFVNHFNLGAFMEKGLTMRGQQTPVQKYW